jgi:hypothetical protein
MHLHKIVIYHFYYLGCGLVCKDFVKSYFCVKNTCQMILSDLIDCKRMIRNILDDNYNIQM